MKSDVYRIIIAAIGLFWMHCGIFESQSSEGSITIQVQSVVQDETGNTDLMLGSVRYVLKQGWTAVGEDTLSRRGSHFERIIPDLEPDGYLVFVYGYASSGDLLGTGISGSIRVVAGKTATAVIEWVPVNSGTVTDIDGNVYHTVTIGAQVWTVENLKVTHYRNGDAIPNVTDDSAWQPLLTGAYCDYDNNTSHASTYGRLYNWYAVSDTRNIAPSGWHVPEDAEWQTLVDYLGGGFVAGGKMKETGTTHWVVPNTGATNSSGFCALPGGYRDGAFNSAGRAAIFWSASTGGFYNAFSRTLRYDDSLVLQNYDEKYYGFSVRLVRD
jgi:uncharacterized protein (TIGR02145 family)